MPTAPGIDQLKHLVVLMMENRSFDHLLGYLKAQDPRIDGVDGTESNPDPNGEPAHVLPNAEYQSQLQPDPGHHFEDVKLQIHGENPGDPKMQGFVKSYYQKQKNISHAGHIMYCFKPEKMPVITTLARKYAVFNRWFSSLPGPTIPNRAFAHYGTSFGRVDMNLFYVGMKYPSIYERMVKNGHTAKIFYYDLPSGTMGMTSILKDQPQLFGTVDQFLADCNSGSLPDYSFIEPNYTDHGGNNGELLACDQHPDHNMLAGEEFIAQIYMAIRNNEALWKNTALLLVYDEHGGIYDHVEPPACVADEVPNAETGFKFDSLGIRVPAVLISPWVQEGTVISDRVFDHASIPATVTKQWIGDWAERSPREKAADTFLDLLSLPAPRTDYVGFTTNADFDDPTGSTQSIEAAPSDASQPQRLLSDLLYDHVRAIHEVEIQLPPDEQTHTDISTITTEIQASAYIADVMSRLLPQAARAGGR
jgi:phospholipase C